MEVRVMTLVADDHDDGGRRTMTTKDGGGGGGCDDGDVDDAIDDGDNQGPSLLDQAMESAGPFGLGQFTVLGFMADMYTSATTSNRNIHSQLL